MGVSVLARLAAGALALLLAAAPAAEAARLKDVASVKGVRENQIIGYGLVVGLNGTGDKQGTEFTVRSLGSLLAKIGVGVDPEAIQVKNVAAVMVTAELPPFARTGSRIDVVVSSLGDARSLEGGTLIVTPLYGADGAVYALAQGPVSVGGFSAGEEGGSSVQKNHPTVARIADGASVERELEWTLDSRESFELALRRADFTTALRSAEAINARFGPGVAQAQDPGTVRVALPARFGRDPVGFLSELEQLEVVPDEHARVVLNERTGTVVMGSEVSITQVAVAHGNLSVTIEALNDVSQPAPFSQGQTTPLRNTAVGALEQEGSLAIVGGPVTINELVRGLNAIGVTPRDLIVILQSIKAAGALSAELELI